MHHSQVLIVLIVGGFSNGHGHHDWSVAMQPHTQQTVVRCHKVSEDTMQCNAFTFSAIWDTVARLLDQITWASLHYSSFGPLLIDHYRLGTITRAAVLKNHSNTYACPVYLILTHFSVNLLPNISQPLTGAMVERLKKRYYSLHLPFIVRMDVWMEFSCCLPKCYPNAVEEATYLCHSDVSNKAVKLSHLGLLCTYQCL